ncbi:MAG: flagellar hook capping FlgD N-terminal domain-containing protein [Bacillota bacterium]
MTTPAVDSSTTSSSSSSKTTTKKELKADDFIKLMITQLQHQDPSEPMKNQELLAQMSQISQLQSNTALQETLSKSNTSLQETLKGLTLQNKLGSAGQLIGKMVAGTDSDGKSITGLVNSVRVENDQVRLELDNGKTLDLDHVTHIAAGPSGTNASSGSTTHHAPA